MVVGCADQTMNPQRTGYAVTIVNDGFTLRVIDDLSWGHSKTMQQVTVDVLITVRDVRMY